jgi:hypothetical protein
MRSWLKFTLTGVSAVMSPERVTLRFAALVVDDSNATPWLGTWLIELALSRTLAPILREVSSSVGKEAFGKFDKFGTLGTLGTLGKFGAIELASGSWILIEGTLTKLGCLAWSVAMALTTPPACGLADWLEDS